MSKKIIFSKNAPKPIGPYSQAVQAGDFLFISGQIPINPETGEVVLGDIETQTKLVMDNIKAILNEAGCATGNIVKTTIYLKDLKQFAKVNEIYGGYFIKEPPARVTVEVSNLPKGASVEIDAIAIKKEEAV